LQRGKTALITLPFGSPAFTSVPSTARLPSAFDLYMPVGANQSDFSLTVFCVTAAVKQPDSNAVTANASKH
jgi:hypothetical protein